MFKTGLIAIIAIIIPACSIAPAECELELEFLGFSPPSLPVAVYVADDGLADDGLLYDVTAHIVELYGEDVMVMVDVEPEEGFIVQYGEVTGRYDIMSVSTQEPFIATFTVEPTCVDNATFWATFARLIGRRLGVDHASSRACIAQAREMILENSDL